MGICNGHLLIGESIGENNGLFLCLNLLQLFNIPLSDSINKLIMVLP